MIICAFRDPITAGLKASSRETMASFERKIEAFLEYYDEMKSVENEEAFLKEFMVSATVLPCPLCIVPVVTLPTEQF